ncbi:MAG TPA: hypothetical protein VM571_06575 [Noviherbaspirillum sp.]|nr:hypothetical protein [Noviherbaspirillum sp.]
MTAPTIHPLWPVQQANSDMQRYAAALNLRLSELGLSIGVANEGSPIYLALHMPDGRTPEPQADNSRRIDAIPALKIGMNDHGAPDTVPFVFDDEGFFRDMPTLLESREEREGYAFVAFANRSRMKPSISPH